MFRYLKNIRIIPLSQKRTVIVIALGLLLVIFFPVIAASTSINNEQTYNHMVAMDDETPHQRNKASDPLKLTLPQFVGLVREKNEQILAQIMEWAIKQEEIKSARAIFEPEYVISYQHEDNRQRNSVEEAVSRQFESAYEERNNNYNMAIEGLLPTGGRLNLGYTKNEISNTLTRSLTDLDEEHRLIVVGSLNQPLLKNAGIKTTMANIRVAEADADVALHGYRQEMMRVVVNAVVLYWDLYLAQEKVRMRRESVSVAEQILADNRERFRTGKMAEIEVLEAEAGVAIRKSLESEAEQNLVSAMNDVRTMFSSSAAAGDSRVEAADRPELERLEPEYEDALHRALKLRPEYLSARRKIERENIRIGFAENQQWPQLDLKASYGLNGLDRDGRGARRQVERADFDSWSVGLELRVPFLGGLKDYSELQKVKLQKKQALLELKAVEVAMANAVNTAVRNVYSAVERVGYSSRVADFNRRLLNVELARLEAGKSNSRLVLEKEEDFRKALETELESRVNHKEAILELRMADGTLLLHHSIEVMEVEL